MRMTRRIAARAVFDEHALAGNIRQLVLVDRKASRERQLLADRCKSQRVLEPEAAGRLGSRAAVLVIPRRRRLHPRGQFRPQTGG
jgi:hypothetical protein